MGGGHAEDRPQEAVPARRLRHPQGGGAALRPRLLHPRVAATAWLWQDPV